MCVCSCVRVRVLCLGLCSNSCLTCQLAIARRFQLDLLMCQLKLEFAVISDAATKNNIDIYILSLTHTHICIYAYSCCTPWGFILSEFEFFAGLSCSSTDSLHKAQID